MSKTWRVRADFMVEAETEDEVWTKWAADEDVMYDSIWSIDLEFDDDEDELLLFDQDWLFFA